jgi:DnaJ-class molecular chaperone
MKLSASNQMQIKSKLKKHISIWVKKHHPDLTKKAESIEYFKEISNSFQILSNEKKTKKFYDENSAGFSRNDNSNNESYQSYKPKNTDFQGNSYDEFFEEHRKRRNYGDKREEYINQKHAERQNNQQR